MGDDLSFARLDFATSERFQLLRRELGVTTFGLNLIVLKPGQRGRIHRHERQEEVFVVLEGQLTLVADGEGTKAQIRVLDRNDPTRHELPREYRRG